MPSKMIASKQIKFAVMVVIWMAVSILSDEVPSSTTITTEVNTECSNSSEIGNVCVTGSDTTLSAESDSSYGSTIPYESTYLLSSSTEESRSSTTNQTAITTNTAVEMVTSNPNNLSVSMSSTSTTPFNVSTVETTTKPGEPATPLPPGKTVGVDQELFGPYSDICSCDLTVGMCDIRCCCDPDCSNSDRLVFASCHQRPAQAVNPRYCYQTQFVYHNNTEFKTVMTKGGLFCIVEDNLQTFDEYGEKDSVTAISDFKKLESRRRFYSWKKKTYLIPEFVEVESHKAEEIVWQLKNSSLSPFDIPVKVAGGFCRATKAVRYLEDVESECSQLAPDSESCLGNAAFNAESYYKHSRVFGVRNKPTSKLGKFTHQGCYNSSCISVKSFLCPQLEASHRNWGECTQVTDIPRPSSDFSQAVCENVVQTVRYLILHNGTQGITGVSAYFTLQNMSMFEPPLGQFSQKFSVEFMWATVKTHVPKRSGRPGYIVGKPLLSGLKLTHTSKAENITGQEAIQLSFDTNNWLGVPKADPRGVCTDSQRHGVLFGENSRSSCILLLAATEFSTTSKCVDVQKKILKLLVGDAIENVTDAKQFNMYVATFGDSIVENTGDWVKVMLETVPGVAGIASYSMPDKKQMVCKNIVTSMHLDVIFANIGPQENPQAKVLAVVLRFGIPQNLLFDCNPSQCATLSNDFPKNYRITSSVTFVDVTKPAIPHFLEPPVYEVKLPHDFFYPFYSGTSVHTANNWLNLMLIVFYVWIS